MAKPQKSAHQRGLGWKHRQRRDHMLRTHPDGTPCWWCNQPMYRNPQDNYDHAPLEADHTNARSIHGTTGNHADRLLHRRCNRQRLDGRNDNQRPAITGQDPRQPLTRTTNPHTPPPPTHLLTWPWGDPASHS